MNKPRKFLVALDQESDRLIWGIPYQEWPRLVPGTPHLAVFQWINKTDITLKQINGVEVKKDPEAKGVFFTVDPPIGEELERITLLRKKCNLTWRWLRNLHQLWRSVQGHLPGVPLGLPGSNDRALFNQEQQRINDIIAEEIHNNHWRIWTAESTEALDIIEGQVFAARQNNAQGHY